MSFTARQAFSGALADPDPAAIAVEVSGTALKVTLSDGREVSAPLVWFPRLLNATEEQRAIREPIGRGHGIHWPELDEDVSARALLG